MPIPQNDTLRDRAIEILNQVKVNHFTASVVGEPMHNGKGCLPIMISADG